jgi:hypothetical protein
MSRACGQTATDAAGTSIEVPGGGGENLIADALYYTFTKNGLQAGGAVAGTKFWKSGDLNRGTATTHRLSSASRGRALVPGSRSRGQPTARHPCGLSVSCALC